MVCPKPLFAVRQKLPHSPATSQKKAASRQLPSQNPKTKSQKPTAQLPSFQYFACKSHGLKILPGKFFAGPMESRFYGMPGGGGYRASQPFSCPLFARFRSRTAKSEKRTAASRDFARDDTQ